MSDIKKKNDLLKTANTYVGKRGYIIRKSFLSSQQITEIKNELTVKPFVAADYGGGESNDPFPIYLENENKLYVPKFYGVEKFGKAQVNTVPPGQDINIDFSLKLKPEQQAPADATVKAYHEQGGGILSLPCGFGKTILALYFISQIKKKTLVVVHKEFLMNQWVERIKFALPNAKIGIIQADKCQIEGNDIVIGMLQTLSMKDFAPDAFDNIGHVIIDECHRIPSRVFSRALLKFNCNYMLGLSATPNRKDGLMKVLKYYIGDIVYMVKSAEKNEIKVERMIFESDNEVYQKEVNNFRGQVQCATMINNICEFLPRTRCMMNRIVELLNQHPERQILILSDRKGHLEDCFKIAHEMGVESVGYYVGGMKKEKLKESESCRLLLGTYPMAKEGLDIPTLNGLVLGSPISDIIQSIGRIDRKKHENIEPLIIDCVDNFSIYESQAKKRLAVYKKKYYLVEDLTIDLDKSDYPIIRRKTYDYHKKKKAESDDEDDLIQAYDSEEDGCTIEKSKNGKVMKNTTLNLFVQGTVVEKKEQKENTETKDDLIGKRVVPSKQKTVFDKIKKQEITNDKEEDDPVKKAQISRTSLFS
jgi:superfamily II DNA or RNA helicase